jgi:hypothetical protein
MGEHDIIIVEKTPELPRKYSDPIITDIDQDNANIHKYYRFKQINEI